MKFNYDALLELCHFLLPEDPSLEKEVQLSIQKPDAFSTQIKYLLQDWIKNEPFEAETIPWYTLIHGLYQRKLVFELSARNSAENMDVLANQLFIELQAHQPNNCDPVPDTMHFVDNFLSLTSAYLLHANYRLAEIRLSSGVSVVTIVPHSVADKCSELMKRSGYGELSLYPSSTRMHQINQRHKNHICEMLEKANSLSV